MSDRPRRLFAAELPATGGELTLSAEAAHHARVLRLARGDRVQLFDGRLGQADAIVTELSRARVVCRAEPRTALPPRTPALHLVLGLPKGGKLEDIARMLAELGVYALHLALCERSVPREGDRAARMARLERVVLEACAQSGQPQAPQLHAPRPLAEIARAVPQTARRLVFWERATRSLDAVLAAPAAPANEIWAVVGPEGGLSQPEVEALAAQGFTAVGLGPALLRVETAAPVVAALLLHRHGLLQ